MATDTGSPADKEIPQITEEEVVKQIREIKSKQLVPIVFVLPVHPHFATKEFYEHCLAQLQRVIKSHGY